MISKAIIEKKIDDYNYKVRIPFINKAAYDQNATATDQLYTACVMQQPGINPHYEVNDVVFVAFELDKHESPVVTGLLRKNIPYRATSDVECQSLIVNVNSYIPGNTTDILANEINNIKEKLNSGGGGGSNMVICSQAEYDALPESVKMQDIVYYITDAPYDAYNIVSLTKAQYNLLTNAQKNDGRFYYVVDEEQIESSAIINYLDNSTNTTVSNKIATRLANNFGPLEITNYASQNYSVGSYVVMNDGSVRTVTTSISAGQQIIPGTNVSSYGVQITSLITNLKSQIHTEIEQTQVSYQHTAANTWENVGLSIVVPTGWRAAVRIQSSWNSAKPIGLGFDTLSSISNDSPVMAHYLGGQRVSISPLFMITQGTWYVYAMRGSIPTAANTFYITGYRWQV